MSNNTGYDEELLVNIKISIYRWSKHHLITKTKKMVAKLNKKLQKLSAKMPPAKNKSTPVNTREKFDPHTDKDSNS